MTETLHHSFTPETYSALSPEWQAEARRLMHEQGRLLEEAHDCDDDQEAATLLDQVAAMTVELDDLTRLLIN